MYTEINKGCFTNCTSTHGTLSMQKRSMISSVGGQKKDDERSDGQEVAAKCRKGSADKKDVKPWWGVTNRIRWEFNFPCFCWASEVPILWAAGQWAFQNKQGLGIWSDIRHQACFNKHTFKRVRLHVTVSTRGWELIFVFIHSTIFAAHILWDAVCMQKGPDYTNLESCFLQLKLSSSGI